MSSVSMTQTYSCSADALWEAISDFGGIARFADALSDSSADGNAVGARRHLTLAGDGGLIVERLEMLDPAARTLSYCILESPLPVADYVSTMQIHERNSGCELEWSSTFEPAGAPEDVVQDIIRGIYAGGFAGLKQLEG